VSWRAYVDESEPDQRSGAGTYLLAAAVIEDQHEDAAVAATRALLLAGQRKLHWHDEGAARRAQLINAVSDLPALYLITVRTDRLARPERRRRLCLAELLVSLRAHGVEQVYLEGREAKQNARDRQLLDALRAQRRIDSQLRMHHQPGPENPLLWIPDIVAGAAGADWTGDPSYLDRIRELTTIIVVQT
jgi:hypothetical protein